MFKRPSDFPKFLLQCDISVVPAVFFNNLKSESKSFLKKNIRIKQLLEDYFCEDNYFYAMKDGETLSFKDFMDGIENDDDLENKTEIIDILNKNKHLWRTLEKGIMSEHIFELWTSRTCNHCGSRNTVRPVQEFLFCCECHKGFDADKNGCAGIAQRFVSKYAKDELAVTKDDLWLKPSMSLEAPCGSEGI